MLATDHGPARISTPRDRNGSFEPKIVRRGQRRLHGFDEKILALYSRGLSTCDVAAHLEDIYGVKVGRSSAASRTSDLLRRRPQGFREAIEAIFPKTTVQTCIVHLIRLSLKYVPRREREQIARDLKPICTAIDAEDAHDALQAFDEKGQAVPRDHPGAA
jgi:transposase-like protein